MLDQPARGADDDIDLAQHGSLHLEVFAAGDQPALEKGELGEALDFLEGLLGQFAGRQQNQRTHADPGVGATVTEQAVEHRQHEGRGLAAPRLGDHPQVLAFQRQRNRSGLYGGGLGEFELVHGFEQAFMQGKLGKHGATSMQMLNQPHRLPRSRLGAECFLCVSSESRQAARCMRRCLISRRALSQPTSSTANQIGR